MVKYLNLKLDTLIQGGWKKDLEEADAKQLVRDAIAAGIFNDMGSGSNVDLVVIKVGFNYFI